MFCDIAEYYLDTKFNENTKILDVCCGTGAFLITALNRIKENINEENQSEELKRKRCEYAQRNSLIGVERDSSMYALAYANMRFHGDGKSNLFNCSSLLIDSFAPVDDSGKTYTDNAKVPLHEALKNFGDIDVGMINPPYSLDKKDNSLIREYPIVQEINELEEKNKTLSRKLKMLRNKKQEALNEEISVIIDKIQYNEELIRQKENVFDRSGLREITIQKGQSELDFVASMLHYLKVGGIGIAIENYKEAYDVLSSLIHGRDKCKYVNNSEMPQAEIQKGCTEIKKWIQNFDYDELYKDVYNEEKLAELYFAETNDYLKIQLFRALFEVNPSREIKEEDVLVKFINESYHIENDYAYYLDMVKFETVPEYIVKAIDDYMERTYSKA